MVNEEAIRGAANGAAAGMMEWVCGGAASALNTIEREWDCVRVGGTTGMVVRVDGVATDTVTRVDEEASCSTVTSVIEWACDGATTACDAVATMQDVAPAG